MIESLTSVKHVAKLLALKFWSNRALVHDHESTG
jgi:hypothetical protein